MTDSLAEKLEVWGFEEGFLVFKDFSLGTCLRLEPKDISCATDGEINAFHDAACDFLNGLPSGLSLQFAQKIDGQIGDLVDRHAGQASDSATNLAQALLAERAAKLEREGSGLRRQSLILAVRRPMQRPKAKASILRWLGFKAKNSETLSRLEIEREAREFQNLIDGIVDALAGLGIEAAALSEEATFQEIFDQWNPRHPVCGLNFNREDFRDDVALNDMVVSLKGFALGPVHHRMVTLKTCPEATYAGMSERLRDLPFDSRLYVSVETLDQDREDLALETQRRIAYAMHSGKKGVSDLESEAKLRDLESLLEKRVAGQEKIFSVSLSVVVRSLSEAEADEQAAKTLQLVRELSGAEAIVESLAAAPQFFDLALPNARSKDRARRLNTSVAADFLPLFGDWAGHEEPRVLLRNRSRGLIGFDPFSPKLANFNQIVSGGSGAGKSFLVNVLIAHLMKEDPKIFVIDIGGSYRKMTENLGGQYVALGESHGLSLNPFDLKEKTEAALDQKTKFMASLVEIMTREENQVGIGRLERAEIERLIGEVLREDESPRLSGLRERLLKSDEPEARRIGKILGPWCGDSPYGKFVDRKTTLSLEKKIVCFDLKALESQPDLQAACLFIVTDLIWREAQADRTSMKLVVFDECWRLIASDAGSKFIGEVFRTFRKYRASAIAISQTMDDFAKSRVAASILPNASVKWVMKQSGANIETVRETLLLNERETKLVESLASKKGRYSEAFLSAGDDRQVVLIESTPLEYWLSTTDPQDLKAYAAAKAENGACSDLDLLKTLALKFPRGASGGGR